jgi:hypothetical protein
MNTEELSNRLTQIVQGITNTNPIIHISQWKPISNT